jgi:Platelet-activating factor acetylhydrolase, isoform II
VLDFELIDTGREERFVPGTPRRIPVRAWYPAAKASGILRPYAKPLEMEHQIKAFMTAFPELKGLDSGALDVTTHAYEGAPALGGAKRPTVIFSHGGFSYIQQNTALMEHLASHGYLVFSISHPYVAIATLHDNGDIVPVDRKLLADTRNPNPDSIADSMAWFTHDDPAERLRVARKVFATTPLAPHYLVWEQDFIHTADRLISGDVPDKARTLAVLVDAERIGYCGHSFGGSGSAATRKDKRIRAAVNIDGGVFDTSLIDTDVDAAILIFHSDRKLQFPGLNAHLHSEFVYERLATMGSRDDVIRLETEGSSHMGHTDLGLLPESPVADPTLKALRGSLYGARMAGVVNDFTKAFFDRYLSGKGAGIDATLFARYPEVKRRDVSYVRALG